MHLKRTEPKSARTDMLPYSVDIVSLDQTGIVAGLSGFFASRGIDISEVSTRGYAAAHTGAPMFAVQMIITSRPSCRWRSCARSSWTSAIRSISMRFSSR